MATLLYSPAVVRYMQMKLTVGLAVGLALGAGAVPFEAVRDSAVLDPTAVVFR